MDYKNLPNFENFLSNRDKGIYEEEGQASIFKGIGSDPYQYMIKGDKTYYALKSKGDLTQDSQSWVEQRKEIGIGAIKDLYAKISGEGTSEIDQETKLLIMELQASLNKVKKSLPKMWMLPLTIDGELGWKTALAWYIIYVTYRGMQDVNDSAYYPGSVQEFKDGFLYNQDVKDPFDVIKFCGMEYEQGSEKEKLKEVIKKTQELSDTISGNLKAGSTLTTLSLKSPTKSIPENIKAEYVEIDLDSPIKNIPRSLSCSYLNIYNTGEPVNIPLIDAKSIVITGKAKLSDEWTKIEYLAINEDEFEGVEAYENPIPKNLKQFGDLDITSSSMKKLPDNITVGKIKLNIRPSSELINSLEPSIKASKEIQKLPTATKVKKPWYKRFFRKGDKKYDIKYESLSSKIYEDEMDDIEDFLSKTVTQLDLSNCYSLETLPVGLVVNGDLVISLSGLTNFTDEEIREVCEISGQIIRY